jgi:hypothetical protein
VPPARRDFGSLWAPGAAIAVTFALAAVLLYVSRSVNRPPAITKVDVQPAIVAAGGTATLRVTAEDPDGDALRFEYTAGTGRITTEPSRPNEARYSPSESSSITDRVTITVTDAHGLSSSAQSAVGIEAAAAAPAAAAPEVEPTPAAVADIAAVLPAETKAPPPMSTAVPTAVHAPQTPAPTPQENRPPVLDGGYRAERVGRNPIRLVATGHDPDNDPIEHDWDMSGCFEIVSQTAHEAEIKFADGCTGGNVTLTWKDPHGLYASTTWTISQ